VITFRKIAPNNIDSLPKTAIRYLDEANRRTPASASRIDVTLDIAKRGYGNIYLIYNGDWLAGACYILTHDTPKGKVVSPVLVGGKNMHIWHDDFYNFIQEFSKLVGAVKIHWMGRKGWLKAYPKSRVIGYVFEHDVDA
jgi:hypothetical protein